MTDISHKLKSIISVAKEKGVSDEAIRRDVDSILESFSIEPMCNLCGLSCTIGNPKSIREPSGLIDQNVNGGYPSTPGNGYGALDDMTSYKFSLCEFCLDWLFTQCMIQPKVNNSDGETIPFEPARQRVAQDEWRSSKQEFYDEYKRRNKAREEAMNLALVREIMQS